LASAVGLVFAAGCEDDSTCVGVQCSGTFATVDGSPDAYGGRDVGEEEGAERDGSPSEPDASDASTSDASDASTPDANDASDASTPDANDGGPLAIATPASPWRIAVGGGFVYATTGGDVVKVPVGGGASSTIQQGGTIGWLAADATNLYFTTSSGTVYRRPHGGTANTPISNEGVAAQAYGLVADATHVYWTKNTSGGTVVRVAIDGSTMAGESVSPALSLPAGLAFHDGSIYVAESNGTLLGAGRIVRLNPDGGAPIAIASNRTGPARPVVDGNRIYWYEGGGSTGPIVSTPLPEGGPIATHANTAVDPSLVTDDNVFYYGNASGGIAKIDVAASKTQTLYSSSQTGGVYGLAVSGNSLFWTDYTGSRLMTAPK